MRKDAELPKNECSLLPGPLFSFGIFFKPSKTSLRRNLKRDGVLNRPLRFNEEW
jgi:hypothetical protein